MSRLPTSSLPIRVLPTNAQSKSIKPQNVTRKLTLFRPSLDDTFFVLVSNELQEQKRFTLHTNVFVARSGFFKAARSAAWNPDPLKPTILDDDDDPEVFENYMRCVYSGDLDPFPYERHGLDDAHVNALIKMWVLADKLLDPKTANLVMDKIVKFCAALIEFRDISCFKLAYSSTAKGSPLRSFFCVMVLCQDISGLFDDPNELPPEFFHDMAVELCRMKKEFTGKNPYECVIVTSIGDLSPCRWHQHDGEKCGE
jgi:hypothetical protein